MSHFGIFHQFWSCLVTLFDRKLQFFKKLTIFDSSPPNQYVNGSRLIHNVEYRKQLENDYLRPQTYWYTLYNNTMCCNR